MEFKSIAQNKKEIFFGNLMKSIQGGSSTPGVYADTYQNRKLGRVGQPYKQGEGEQKKEETGQQQQKGGGNTEQKIDEKKEEKEKIFDIKKLFNEGNGYSVKLKDESIIINKSGNRFKIRNLNKYGMPEGNGTYINEDKLQQILNKKISAKDTLKQNRKLEKDIYKIALQNNINHETSVKGGRENTGIENIHLQNGMILGYDKKRNFAGDHPLFTLKDKEGNSYKFEDTTEDLEKLKEIILENKEKNVETEKKGNQDIEIDVPHLAIFNEEGEEFDLESLPNDTKRKLNNINTKYQNYIDEISKLLKSESIKEKFNPICLNVDKTGNITYDSKDIFGGEGTFSYGRILNDKGKDIDREKFFTISSNLKNSLEKWINDVNSSASSKSNPFQS